MEPAKKKWALRLKALIAARFSWACKSKMRDHKEPKQAIGIGAFSAKNSKTDHFDLYQMHHVGSVTM